MLKNSDPRNDAQPISLRSSNGWSLNFQQQIWSPPTDVFETLTEIFVRVEIAGMSCPDFEINFDKNTLSIRGVRTDKASRKAFHRMEIRYGEFEVNIEINTPAQIDNIAAEYRDGFLWITIPKAEPKRIKIQPD